MHCYRDTTYCASPNCKNECGHKMSDEDRHVLPPDEWVAWGYFCGEPEEEEWVTEKKAAKALLGERINEL